MAKKIGTITVTVVRRPKVDKLSPPQPAVEHDVEGCAITPRTSFEQDKGWVIVSGRTIFAPYDADIQADDRVRIPGEPGLWNVDGEAGDYATKKGKGKATIVYVDKVS